MPKLLMMKERTLLLNSDVIQKFPDILEILVENQDITDEFIQELPDEKRNFFENMLPRVLKQAISEWKGDPKKIEDMGPNKSKWKYCSLDNRRNRLIFYIVNKLNNITMNVGSECIKHFWNFWNNDYDGKSIPQLIREATNVKLLSDLNDEIPGIVRNIDSWNNIVDNCDVILPRSLETPYLDLGKKASRLLEDYLNGKEDCNFVEQLKLVQNEQGKLISQIEDYALRNSLEEFVPKKEVRTWLKNQGLTQVIETLKDDEVITWPTAHRIAEPSFMNLLIPKLNTVGIMNFDLKILSADERRCGYILEATRSKIGLFVKHKDLVFDYGCLIFNEQPIEELSYENLLKLCSLNDKKDVLDLLSFMTYKLGISFEDVDLESNEAFVFDVSTRKFASTKPLQFANKFKGLAIGAKDITNKELLDYIKSLPGTRYTKSELEDLKHDRQVHNIRKY